MISQIQANSSMNQNIETKTSHKPKSSDMGFFSLVSP